MATPRPKKDIDWNPVTPPGQRYEPGAKGSSGFVYGAKGGLTPDVLRTFSNEANLATRKDLESKVQKTVNRQGNSVRRAESNAERKIERLRARSERNSAKELKSVARKAGSTARRDIKDSVRKMRIASRAANSFGGRIGGMSGGGGAANIEQIK